MPVNPRQYVIERCLAEAEAIEAAGGDLSETIEVNLEILDTKEALLAAAEEQDAPG